MLFQNLVQLQNRQLLLGYLKNFLKIKLEKRKQDQEFIAQQIRKKEHLNL